MDDQNRKAIERYLQAAQDGDLSAMADAYHEDAVQEWPQSGERIVGRPNIMSVTANYPGLPKASVRRRKRSTPRMRPQRTARQGAARRTNSNVRKC